MKTEKKETIGHKLLQLWKNAEDRNVLIELNHKSVSNGIYNSERIESRKLKIPQNITVFAQKLLGSLNLAELRMVAKISSELKRNNALWYFEYRKMRGRDERTILSLRKKKILIKTDDCNFHLVNPFALRTGGIPDVLVCTRIFLLRKSVASIKHIPHLRPPKHYQENLWNFIEIDQLDTSLVDPFV